jgi:hypothetical protein
MQYTQSYDELIEHLKDQIYFLKNSCTSYDNGFKKEAKRLAVTIRTLVHDTTRSISLLTHLSRKNIDFYNTSLPFDEENLSPFTGLTGIRSSSEGIEHWPFLDDGHPSRYANPWIKFDDWWNSVVINDHKNQFTRKKLVLAVANQDGGAHVDSKLDHGYSNLTKNNSVSWTYEEPINQIELASLRQIAHEVLKTLEKEFPSLTN